MSDMFCALLCFLHTYFANVDMADTRLLQSFDVPWLTVPWT